MLNAETTGIGVAALVRHHITELLGEAGITVGRLDDTDELNALGLNSLMLARLILQLEMETGVDPFAEELAVSDVRTVAELTTAYENARATATATA